jgi:membrane-associated phospholipid phosphatase
MGLRTPWVYDARGARARRPCWRFRNEPQRHPSRNGSCCGRDVRTRRLLGTLAALGLSVFPSVAGADEAAPSDHFAIQPVADGAIIVTGAGFSTLLGLILDTGEIQPLAVQPGAESRLLGIDRIAVTQTIDPHAGTYSDIGLYTGIGLAVADTLSTAFRDRWEAAFTDGVMYAESISLTLAVDDIVKIAVRRPRPSDYSAENAGNTTNTDLSLSFFSGHEAVLSSITATATYLAFIHSPDSPRPWLTLAGGTLLTGFVGYERVRAGAHFPTDVIMGALAGSSVGVLVPHLHRGGTRPVWVDLAPASRGSGATVDIGGFF